MMDEKANSVTIFSNLFKAQQAEYQEIKQEEGMRRSKKTKLSKETKENVLIKKK